MMKHWKLVNLMICLSLLLNLGPGGYRPALAGEPAQQSGTRLVDIVFVVDTSGSMDEEFSTLCSVIDRLVADLEGRGIQVRYTVLGIAEPRACASQHVAGSIHGATASHKEDWGPAVRDLAVAYDWQPGYTRVVVPMSDEGPYHGSECLIPGNDEDSITEAIRAANSNSVRAAPILGDISPDADPACIQELAERLANGTGGAVFNLYDDPTKLADGITALIEAVAADRDGDGIADDDDPAPDDPCSPNPQAVCLPPQVCGISNTPHWDDDEDGRIDEETQNDIDDDGDGLIDEDVGGVNCPYPDQDCGVNSHRGFDDDDDGRVDEEEDNGRDDDGDNYVDEDVICPCPASQEAGASDTPGVDDDHDFRTDEEADNGLDDDGDGCVDEDVGAVSYPDFAASNLSVSPSEPEMMEKTKVEVKITNIGRDYVPHSGKAYIELTSISSSRGEQWVWYFTGELGEMPSGDWTYWSADGFRFTSSKIDKVQVCVTTTDPDANLDNNCVIERIQIKEPENPWVECAIIPINALKFGLDALTAGSASTAVEVTELLLSGSAFQLACEEYHNEEACAIATVKLVIDICFTVLKDFLAKPVKFVLSIAKDAFFLYKASEGCGEYLGSIARAWWDELWHRGEPVNGIIALSPVYVQAVDSQGRRAGFSADGQIIEEIPDAIVAEQDGVKVVLYTGTDTASIQLFGTGSGTADLLVGLSTPDLQGHTVFYDQVPVNPGTYGTIDVSDAQYHLELDDDSDGKMDRIVQPDEEYVSAIGPSEPQVPDTDGGGLGVVVVLVVVAVAGLGAYALTQAQRRRLVVEGVGVVSPAASLVILRGPGAGQRISLTGAALTIGRSRDSALRLSGSSISRHHAVIRYARGRYYLQDQGSTHGTFVNGRRIDAVALNPGDHITIGDTEFEFRLS